MPKKNYTLDCLYCVKNWLLTSDFLVPWHSGSPGSRAKLISWFLKQEQFSQINFLLRTASEIKYFWYYCLSSVKIVKKWVKNCIVVFKRHVKDIYNSLSPAMAALQRYHSQPPVGSKAAITSCK